MNKTKVDEMKARTDEELEEIIRKDDHSYGPFDGEDDDLSGSEWIHFYWDCDTCRAEDEREHRRFLARSLLPGTWPADAKASLSKEASKLYVGDVCEAERNPGTRAKAYYEAITVEKSSEEVVTVWKLRNSDEDPFTTVYAPDCYLDVIETAKSVKS